MGKYDDYWMMKEYTHIKHKILEEYLKKHFAILGRGRTIHYVDTHAGRGIYENGEKGSPVIAMLKGQELHEHHEGEFFLNCYNVEKDDNNFQSLEQQVSAHRYVCSSVAVENYQGSFQDHIPAILDKIPKTDAVFFFVDPFSYSDVVLQDMLMLMQNRRYSEVFITFMSQYIARFMSDSTKHQTLSKVLDTDKWHKLFGINNSETKVVELYAKRLMESGRERFNANVWAYPIKVELSRKSPYHLVHVSQSPKARIEMEKAVLSENSPFQSSERLFTDCEGIVYEALNKLPSGIEAIRLAGHIWLEHIHRTWKNDIRVAVRDLNKKEIVKIMRHKGGEAGKNSLPQEKDIIILTGKKLESSGSLF